MSKSILTRIIEREIPADILHEDDLCIAIRDINPVAPSHFLVVPKKPIDMIENLTAEDAPLVGHLVFVAKQLAAEHGLTNGYRLVFNNGPDAGQTVYHIHLHVVGGRPLAWPPG